MHTMTPTQRSLDRAEAFFWLLDRCSSMNFAILVEGEGSVARGRLEEALARAQSIHPMLAVAIEADARGRLAFVPRPGRPVALGVEEADEAWRERFARLLVKPFEPGEAPLARAHWFALGLMALVAFALVFHHAIGDGRSGLRLAVEIVDEARGGARQAPREADRPSLMALFPAGLAGEAGAARAAEWRAAKRDAPRSPKPDPLPGFGATEGRPEPRIVTLRFEREAVEALAARARREGASVHGAIGAAELVAARERFGAGAEPNLMLTSPVDLRGSLARPVDDATPGFFVTLLSSTGRVPGASAFWPLARHLTEDLRHQLAGGFGHLFYHFIPAAESILPTAEGLAGFRSFMARMPQAFVLSNVGRLPALPEAAGVRIDDVSFALCPMPHQPLFVAASTWGGRLTLNVNYDGRRLPAAHATAMAASMRALLANPAEAA